MIRPNILRRPVFFEEEEESQLNFSLVAIDSFERVKDQERITRVAYVEVLLVLPSMPIVNGISL